MKKQEVYDTANNILLTALATEKELQRAMLPLDNALAVHNTLVRIKELATRIRQAHITVSR